MDIYFPLRREGRVFRLNLWFLPRAFLLHGGHRNQPIPGLPCALCSQGGTISMQGSDATRREKAESRSRNAPIRGRRHRRKRVIQYAAAYRLKHWRLRDTGSPGPASARASARPRAQGRAGAFAKAASRAMTTEGALDLRGALPLAALGDNTTMTSHMNIVPSP